MTQKIALLPAWAAFGILIGPALLNNFLPHPIGLILTMATLCMWVYSLGTEAHRALPQELKLPIVKFKISILYATIYEVIASMSFSEIMPYAMPFHLLAMCCMFYCLYYVAKGIRTFELNRIAKFEEWFAAFCGMGFYPIGVWFIQRKIQRISASRPHA